MSDEGKVIVTLAPNTKENQVLFQSGIRLLNELIDEFIANSGEEKTGTDDLGR